MKYKVKYKETNTYICLIALRDDILLNTNKNATL